MMKKATRLWSIVLCLAMLLSCVQISASALPDWNAYYSDYEKTKGNVLMNPGSNETERNFSWYSDKGSRDAKVLLSESAEMKNPVSFSGRTLRTPQGDCVNKVTVSGLKADTTYYYQCVTSTDQREVASFSTVDGNDFTAMYVTDIHVTYEEDDMDNALRDQGARVDTVLRQASDKSSLDLVISGGDQASYGLRTEYMSVMASPLWSSIPFALCVGNHDRKGFDYKYFNNNPNKYTRGISSYIAEDYWYVKGDVLFMVFDSNCFSAVTHRRFAEDAIAKNPNVKWKVAAFHHDMYGVMSEKRMDYSEDYLRPDLARIFDAYGVDLVLTGHTHHYTISNAVYRDETVDSIKGKDSIKDAKGTIYMVSGSINHPRLPDNDSDVFDENIGYSYLTDEVLYNLLDFSENSIRIRSYVLDSETPFHTFTIEKTTQNGGHPAYSDDSFDKWQSFKLEFEAFFEEIGIAFKLLFNRTDILNKQK